MWYFVYPINESSSAKIHVLIAMSVIISEKLQAGSKPYYFCLLGQKTELLLKFQVVLMNCDIQVA